MIRTTVILFLLAISNSAQPIVLSGSILQKEFTWDNKISGFFTYMNNTDQALQLDIIKSNGKETVNIVPKSGKQIKVLEQTFGADVNNDQIYGDFELLFKYNINGQAINILSFKNYKAAGPTLRGVGISFMDKNDDSGGEYFEIKVEWKTIEEGILTETKKCYITNGD